MKGKVYYITEKNVKGLITYSASVAYKYYQDIRLIAATCSLCVLLSCALSLWLNTVTNYFALYSILSFGIVLFMIYLISGRKNKDYFIEKEAKRFNDLMYQTQVEGEIDSIIENIDDMFGTPGTPK